MPDPPIIMAAVPETRSALPLPPEESERLRSLRERLAAATLRPEAGGRRGDAPGAASAGGPAGGRPPAAPYAGSRRFAEHARSRPLAESLLDQFPLDSKQGKALMSLAEALLRTPDPRLRRPPHRRAAEPPCARAGRRAPTSPSACPWHCSAPRAGCCRTQARRLREMPAARSLAPVMAPLVRAALRRGMRMMGHAFIVGESIELGARARPARP